MLAELRRKSQITIPKQIINKIGLEEGDQLEVIENNGVIELIPVAIYPKHYIEELKDEIADLKQKIQAGDVEVFNSVDDMMKSLDEV